MLGREGLAQHRIQGDVVGIDGDVVDRLVGMARGHFAVESDLTPPRLRHDVRDDDALAVEVQSAGQSRQGIGKLAVGRRDIVELHGDRQAFVHRRCPGQAVIRRDHAARLEGVPQTLLTRFQRRVETLVQDYVRARHAILVPPLLAVPSRPALKPQVHRAVLARKLMGLHHRFGEIQFAGQVIDHIRKPAVANRYVPAHQLARHLALERPVEISPRLDVD